MDALKNRITASMLSWRVLGKNLRQTAPNRATMIGATNPDLSEVLYDPTGMRRFLQIEALARIDWEAIGKIDYAAMWSSVNHLDPCPLLPVLKELRERQEELRAKDAVEEWLDNNCVVGIGWTKAQTLYRYFLDAMKDQR